MNFIWLVKSQYIRKASDAYINKLKLKFRLNYNSMIEAIDLVRAASVRNQQELEPMFEAGIPALTRKASHEIMPVLKIDIQLAAAVAEPEEQEEDKKVEEDKKEEEVQQQ